MINSTHFIQSHTLPPTPTRAQALTRRFEQLAGRTAMIAAAVALAAELAMPSSGGVFGWAASSDLAAQLAALGTFMLCCSGGHQGGQVVRWWAVLEASVGGGEKVALPCRA